MQRITINIDLDENELLEKEVEEAIKGHARKIVREAIDGAIREEIARVADNIAKEAFSPPRWNGHPETGGKYYQMVYNTVKEAIQENGIEIHDIIERLLEEKSDLHIDYVIEQKMSKAEISIADKVTEKCRNEIGKIKNDMLIEIISKLALPPNTSENT